MLAILRHFPKWSDVSPRHLRMVECRSLSEVLPLGLIWLEFKVEGYGLFRIHDLDSTECYFTGLVWGRRRTIEVAVPIGSKLIVESILFNRSNSWRISTLPTRDDIYKMPPSVVEGTSSIWRVSPSQQLDATINVQWRLKFPRASHVNAPECVELRYPSSEFRARSRESDFGTLNGVREFLKAYETPQQELPIASYLNGE
jgi:hypothetical protein